MAKQQTAPAIFAAAVPYAQVTFVRRLVGDL